MDGDDDEEEEEERKIQKVQQGCSGRKGLNPFTSRLTVRVIDIHGLLTDFPRTNEVSSFGHSFWIDVFGLVDLVMSKEKREEQERERKRERKDIQSNQPIYSNR